MAIEVELIQKSNGRKNSMIINQNRESIYDNNNSNNKISKMAKYFRVKNQLIRESLAECFGTFILVTFINACIAQNVFYAKDSPYKFSLISVNFACGFGVTAGVLVAGNVSAHINPAVSLAMLLIGKISILKFFVFTLSQMLGGFLGAFSVYVTYYDMLTNFEPAYSLETAGIFATYPHEKLSVLGGLFDQVFATTLLIIVVLAVSDKKSKSEISHAVTATVLGGTVILIGTTFCYNSGYAINPARDFGPRLLTYIAGWGSQVFTAGNYFFWIPIVGPMIGAVVGTIAYYGFIGNHWPDDGEELYL